MSKTDLYKDNKINPLKDRLHRVLTGVSKPARYVGGELNMSLKDPEKQRIKVCLAFPDIYDIGQSYIGFHILYNILNKRKDTLCERTFSPWPDMEEVMRRENLPLWSLENFLSVGSFDIVGFTLQYELHYTTVLNMLDLAGIPLYSSERKQEDPLVIGGGTCCVNPEPLTDFFDAFLLGDGEEAFPEILDLVENAKENGLTRNEILENLSSVKGVYVPSLYKAVYGADGAFRQIDRLDGKPAETVNARIVCELKPEHYPDRPLVPLTEVVHDRLSIEVMRGCTRGCRFCGAGMTYRPHRLRPAEEIIKQAVDGIGKTGWDEISLVSLSTTDHPELEKIVKNVGAGLNGKAVSLSLSSLRADNFSLSMADATAGGRKTSLTFAPEAGSQRLRNVINKNLTEEQLFETVETAFANNWKAVKLYYMIGLPTETDQDVLQIAKMLNSLGQIVKKYQGRRINVTISPFSPKPVTPFQWESQDSGSEISRKLRLIKDNLRSRRINIKEPNPFPSLLECRLARSDRRASSIIFEAWKRGSRLDGWSEHFRRDIWEEVFKNAGIDLWQGGGGSDPGEPLPWAHLHFGVEQKYLASEREKAYREEATPDCRENCGGCGPYALFCKGVKKEAAAFETSQSEVETGEMPGIYGRRRKSAPSKPQVSPAGARIRVKYSKTGSARYTGHLDLIRIFDRTLRRAGIPVAYSMGFHPHPKISFGHPLPLGYQSIAEYVDITLREPHPGIETSLRQGFPYGFEVIETKPVSEKADSLVSLVSRANYFVHCEITAEIASSIREILDSESLTVVRSSKKGDRIVDVRPGIHSLTMESEKGGFSMELSLVPERSAKPLEVLGLIFPPHIQPDVVRTEQFVIRNGEKMTPLEVMW